MEHELQARVSRLLEEARESSQQGQREKAYQSTLSATSIAPDEPLAWYMRARNAASPEEKLMCLSRAIALNPDFMDARRDLRFAVKNLTERDPFLAYVNETPEFYQVRSGADLLLNIPKDRAYELPFPQRRPGPASRVSRWFTLAVFGLILGGIGGFLIAPIAAIRAARLLRRAPSRPDRVRLGVMVILSVLVWAASIPIAILFIVRFLPF